MEEDQKQSKMTWIEWIIIGFVSFVIDIVQIILNIAFGAGVLANRIINIVYGAILAGYLYLRGVSLVNTRRLVPFLGTFIVEFIPVVDSIPTWTIDTIWTWWTTRKKDNASNVDEMELVEGVTGPLNRDGSRQPPPRQTLNSNGSRSPIRPTNTRVPPVIKPPIIK